MNILIPMAGAGSRFSVAGYTQHKPVIPTTNRHTGQRVPMVVSAVSDLPVDVKDASNTLTFIIRDFHERDRVKEEIAAHYPNAAFIAVEHLTEGQASTCLLAKKKIDNDEPLLIAACDNGMDVGIAHFMKSTQDADALIFTFRDNPAVTIKPEAYGWIKVKEKSDEVIGVSIKKPLSTAPMRDHAVVGTFWFKRGHDFVEAAEIMIRDNERINNEFYIDQLFQNMVERGKRVKVLEVSRYLCWGTPQDYEDYENTLRYWGKYVEKERLL